MGEQLKSSLIVTKLENSNDYQITLRNDMVGNLFFCSKNFSSVGRSEDDITKDGINTYPKMLDNLVTAINNKWGKETATRTWKTCTLGKVHFYQYTFTISPEKIKQILPTIPDNTIKPTNQ